MADEQNYKLITGNSLQELCKLEDDSINCIITSPPYWGLRNYGTSGQIGLEPLHEYIDKLVDVLRECRRALRADGTLWLNIGDSYNSGNSGGLGGSTISGGQRNQGESNRHKRPSLDVVKKKELIGVPWRLAFALSDDGWYLRQDIIWHKPNPMPESVTDRCTKSHEYLFLLSKNPRYYFDKMGIQEQAISGYRGSKFNTGKTAEHQLGRSSNKPRVAENLSHKYVSEYESSETEEHRLKADLMKIADTAYAVRNRRSVWTIASEPLREAHFAAFPAKLIDPCVLSGCPIGGTVLDPFSGAGTTGLVALRRGRKYVGIDITQEYNAIAERRIQADIAKRA